MTYGTININTIDKDCVEFLGKRWYVESYLKEMMDRKYKKGYDDGLRKPVIHKIEEIL